MSAADAYDHTTIVKANKPLSAFLTQTPRKIQTVRCDSGGQTNMPVPN